MSQSVTGIVAAQPRRGLPARGRHQGLAYIDDAIASLERELTDDEAAALEAAHTPHYDFQGISGGAERARISARLGIEPADS